MESASVKNIGDKRFLAAVLACLIVLASAPAFACLNASNMDEYGFAPSIGYIAKETAFQAFLFSMFMLAGLGAMAAGVHGVFTAWQSRREPGKQPLPWKTSRAFLIAGFCMFMLPYVIREAGGTILDARFAKVPPSLEQKAQAGDAESQYVLGVIDSLRIPEDYTNGAWWLRQAAQQGYKTDDPGALLAKYGVINVTLPKSDEEPTLRKWAESGECESQYKLGLLYTIQAPPKYDEAAKWLQKAADQFDEQSAGALGGLYATGEGVTKSGEEAYFWSVQTPNWAERRFLWLDYHLAPWQILTTWRRLETWNVQRRQHAYEIRTKYEYERAHPLERR